MVDSPFMDLWTLLDVDGSRVGTLSEAVDSYDLVSDGAGCCVLMHPEALSALLFAQGPILCVLQIRKDSFEEAKCTVVNKDTATFAPESMLKHLTPLYGVHLAKYAGAFVKQQAASLAHLWGPSWIEAALQGDDPTHRLVLFRAVESFFREAGPGPSPAHYAAAATYVAIDPYESMPERVIAVVEAAARVYLGDELGLFEYQKAEDHPQMEMVVSRLRDEVEARLNLFFSSAPEDGRKRLIMNPSDLDRISN